MPARRCSPGCQPVAVSRGRRPRRQSGRRNRNYWRKAAVGASGFQTDKSSPEVENDLRAFSVLVTTMRRIQIYDTTLRDGSQGEGISFSLQDKLLIARAARQPGLRFRRRGLSRSRTKRTAQFFQRVRRPRPEARPGLRLRHDAPPGRRAEDDPGHAGPASIRGPGVITIVGKTSIFHVREVLARLAGRKPGHDRRQRRLSARGRAAR